MSGLGYVVRKIYENIYWNNRSFIVFGFLVKECQLMEGKIVFAFVLVVDTLYNCVSPWRGTLKTTTFN